MPLPLKLEGFNALVIEGDNSGVMKAILVSQFFNGGIFMICILVSKHYETFLIYLFDKITFGFIYFLYALWESMPSCVQPIKNK